MTSTPHYQRYAAAAIQSAGFSPSSLDRNWRAALWLLTTREDLWAKLENWVDCERLTIRRRRATDLSQGEAVIVQLALYLFDQSAPSPQLLRLVYMLDNVYYAACIEALAIMRGVPVEDVAGVGLMFAEGVA